MLESLDRRIDEVEQYCQRMCLRFDNIEVSQDSSKEDCVKIISEIMKETKCGAGKQEIDRAHRVGPKKTSKNRITTQQIIVSLIPLLSAPRCTETGKRLLQM